MERIIFASERDISRGMWAGIFELARGLRDKERIKDMENIVKSNSQKVTKNLTLENK